MGKPFLPYYGEDLGATIQDVEKIVAKIKTNKYSKKDLLALVDANSAIVKYLIENED